MMESGEDRTVSYDWLSSTALKNFLNVLHTGEGGGWYGSGSTQPSHSSERSESQKFQGNSMRNRNPFSIALDLDMNFVKKFIVSTLRFSFSSNQLFRFFFVSFKSTDLISSICSRIFIFSKYYKKKIICVCVIISFFV